MLCLQPPVWCRRPAAVPPLPGESRIRRLLTRTPRDGPVGFLAEATRAAPADVLRARARGAEPVCASAFAEAEAEAEAEASGLLRPARTPGHPLSYPGVPGAWLLFGNMLSSKCSRGGKTQQG